MKKDKKTIKRINAFCLALLAAALVFSCLYIPVYSALSDFRIPYVAASSSPSRVEVQNGIKLYQNKNSSVGGLYLLTRSQTDNAVCGGNMSRLFIACDVNSSSVIYSFLYQTGLPVSHTASFIAYHGYYYCSVQASFYNEMSECYNSYTSEADFLADCDNYFGFATPTPEPTPAPTPVPDLSYLLPNSDIPLPSLTIENFNDNVEPVIIGSASNAGLFAFAAPSVEIYGCYIVNTFYFFTKDDRAAANSVGVSETDFMGRLVSITLSNAITPYPLTSVKYGSISSYSILSSEKNSSFITFSSLAEAAAFYDTYIEEPTYTPEPPPTPTPGPYDPAGVPTIPPGDPSYETFFGKLSADAQNAFNALYLSWMGASSKFYSGIFFIGLPIAIAIFGLVASIVFGDDD